MNDRLICKKANQLVRFYRTRDPFEMIKGMNVILVFHPLKDVRGFYQYFQRNNIIYIDEGLDEFEKRFVCAHELGHMILHKKTNAIFMDTKTHFKSDRFEREANLFAVDLLIPDEIVLNNPGFTIEQLARLTGFEEKLIRFKAYNKQKNEREHYGF